MEEKEIISGNTTEERDYEQEIIELLQSSLPDEEIAEKLATEYGLRFK